MENQLIFEIKSNVANITLNQPKSRNALDEKLTLELIKTLKKAEESKDVTAILLTANGDSFSAGGDLREFREKIKQSSLQVYDEGKYSAELFKKLESIRKPLIGAINGAAFGGGCGLACACHVVIASDRARFGLTEIRLGLFTMVILPTIQKAIG